MHHKFVRIAVVFFLGVMAPLGVAAQHDEMVTVHFKGNGSFVPQSGQWPTFKATVPEGRTVADPSINPRTRVSQATGSYNIDTPWTDLRVEVGRTYYFTLQHTGPGSYINNSAYFSVLTPPGYRWVFVDMSGPPALGVPYGFRILPDVINYPSSRIGEAESFSDGRLSWGVSLGSLRNGTSAGSLRLIDIGLTNDWTSAATPSGLKVVSPVQPHAPGSVFSQILLPGALVKAVVSSSTKYTLQFFDPANVSGTAYPYTTSGTPFMEYEIEKPSGSNTKIQITKRVKNTSGGVIRTERTAITRSGTWVAGSSNYTWTIDDWYEASGSAFITRTDVWAAPSGQTYGNAFSLAQSSTVASSGYKTTERFAWGEEPVSVRVGNSGLGLTTDYSYYSDSAKIESYGRLKSVEYPDGSFEVYEYYAAGQGGTTNGGHRVHRPYKNSPSSAPSDPANNTAGEITQYWYEPADPGYPQRLEKVETKTDNKLTRKTTFAYSEPSGYEANSHSLVKISRVDYDSAATSLETISQYYRGVNNGFKSGQIFSVQRPDKTKTVYAYHEGSWSGTAFTAGTGSAMRVAVIHGAIEGGVNAPALDSYSLTSSGNGTDTFKLHDGLSTREDTIRNERGFIVRTEFYVWNSNAWHSVSHETYGYDANKLGLVTSRTGSNNALYTSTYTGERKDSDTNAFGVVHTYSNYDPALRPGKITREALGGTGDPVPAVETVLEYNAADQLTKREVGTSEKLTSLWTYDSAGRLATFTTPNEGSHTITYAQLSPGSRRTTEHDGTGAEHIETLHADGSVLSRIGSGRIAEYFDYSVETDGRQRREIRIGSASSPRLSETWSDWLGRTIKTSRPGFTGQPAFVNELDYDSTTGQLVESTESGMAATLYEYDSMGRMVRSGLKRSGGSGLVAASTDRITETDTKFESFDGGWWRTEKVSAYFFDNTGGTPTRLSTKRTRLKGFGTGELAEVRVWGADYDPASATGFSQKSVVSVDRTNKKVTEKTNFAGITNADVRIMQNGALTNEIGLYSNGTSDAESYVYSYDTLSRLVSSQDPRTETETTTNYFNGKTLVSGTSRPVNPSGSVTTSYEYDSAGRLTRSVDESGQSTRFDYDLLGRVTHRWGGGTNPVEYAYDLNDSDGAMSIAFGDLTTQRTYQAGSNWDATTWAGATKGTADSVRWSYDAPSGLLSYKKMMDGNTHVYRYDAAGRLKERDWSRKIAHPSSTSLMTSYNYDSETGELLSEDYSHGPTTDIVYTYTRMGQLKTVTDRTGLRTFNYDSGSPWRVANEDLNASYFGSRRITHQYETSGQKGRRKGFALGTSGSTDSDLKQVTNFNGTTGRISTIVSEYGGGNARTFTYGYATDSNLLDTLSVSGSTFAVDRTWDSKRDLLQTLQTQIASSDVAQFDYAYTARGKRDWEKRSGSSFNIGSSNSAVTVDYQYNNRGELTKALTYLGTESAIGTPSLELPNLQHEYAYDNAGNRVEANQTKDGAKKETSAFNNMNQQTSRQNKSLIFAGTVKSSSGVAVALNSDAAIAPTRQSDYWSTNFDPGNGSGPVYNSVTVWAGSGTGAIGSESRSQLQGAAAQNFTHDQGTDNSVGRDGNLFTDGLWEYAYDAENRLISAVTSSAAVSAGHPATTLQFEYDYLGRRVQKAVTTGGNTTYRRYIYDGWNLVAEFDAPSGTSLGAIKRHYTWGVEQRGTFSQIGAAGALLQITDRETTGNPQYLPAYDANGNVMALYNATDGSEAAVYEYSPYGQLTRMSGHFAAANPFRYSTKFADKETGLIYFGHRYYSPQTGRFINRDPIGEAGGNNLYQYVGNDPINNEDFLGLSGDSPFDGGSRSTISGPFAGFWFDWARFLSGPSINSPLHLWIYRDLYRRERDENNRISQANSEAQQTQNKEFQENQKRHPSPDVGEMADAGESLAGANTNAIDAPDNAEDEFLSGDELYIDLMSGPMLASRGTGRTTQGATIRGRSLADIELQHMREVLRHGRGGTNDALARQRAQERLDNFRRANGIGAPRGPAQTELRPAGARGENPYRLSTGLQNKLKRIHNQTAAGGNRGISGGPVSQSDALRLGIKFVGPGYRVMSNGQGLVSADGLRTFRFPQVKRGVNPATQQPWSPTGRQANFETREFPGLPANSNVHVNVLGP
jgi:RHS repeat-associated protein